MYEWEKIQWVSALNFRIVSKIKHLAMPHFLPSLTSNMENSVSCNFRSVDSTVNMIAFTSEWNFHSKILIGMKKEPRKGEFHWAYNDHCVLIRIARLCRRNKQQLESQWREKTKVYFSLTLCIQGLFHIVFTQPLTGRAATSWNLADHLGGKKRGASSRPCIGKYTLRCVQRADGWEHRVRAHEDHRLMTWFVVVC